MPTKSDEIPVIIDMADNAQVENTSPSTNEENLYGAIVGGAGASGAGASGAGAGASGAGAGASGAGAGASGAGDGKKDEADATGGNIPDGTGPASTNNNPTDSPDSPCSK